MLNVEIKNVANTAGGQLKGSYTTESDAVTALVLVQKLALAILGEQLPPPVLPDPTDEKSK